MRAVDMYHGKWKILWQVPNSFKRQKVVLNIWDLVNFGRLPRNVACGLLTGPRGQDRSGCFGGRALIFNWARLRD